MVLTQWETLYGLFFFAFFEKIVVPILTSGGPASFIMPLQIGKTPIVVPRQHQFNEHVNDHQVEFARNRHANFTVSMCYRRGFVAGQKSCI